MFDFKTKMKNLIVIILVVFSLTSNLYSQTDWNYLKLGNDERDYNKSIKYYDSALELNQNFWEAFERRGFAKLMISDYSESIKDFNKIIENRLNEYIKEHSGRFGLLPNSYYYRGEAKAFLGDYMGSIIDFTNAIELDSFFTMAYVKRGISK